MVGSFGVDSRFQAGLGGTIYPLGDWAGKAATELLSFTTELNSQ